MANEPYFIEPLSRESDERALHDALLLVLRTLPEPTAESLRWAVVAAAQSDTTALGRLYRAYDPAKRTVGAVWAQLRPGNVAVVWPPQWLTAPPAGPDPLLAALLDSLTAEGVTLAQSLLPDALCADAQALLGAGFVHLADLNYLGADAESPRSPAESAAAPLSFVPFTAGERRRLAALVERTYDGTLDCPALNGLRAAEEVLDEYETVGSSGARQWYFVRHDAGDVGCLLLAEHSQQDQVELVYMALIPEARGRGWGELLARESLRIAAILGRARVVLAVDAANSPAAALYRRAGFQAWETRSVFVKSLRPAAT